MKLSLLAEAILETIAMDCDALKKEIQDTAAGDARGERIGGQLWDALDSVSKARDAYKTMHNDMALEMKRKNK